MINKTNKNHQTEKHLKKKKIVAIIKTQLSKTTCEMPPVKGRYKNHSITPSDCHLAGLYLQISLYLLLKMWKRPSIANHLR